MMHQANLFDALEALQDWRVDNCDFVLGKQLVSEERVIEGLWARWNPYFEVLEEPMDKTLNAFFESLLRSRAHFVV
jgi:hypothetical protein